MRQAELGALEKRIWHRVIISNLIGVVPLALYFIVGARYFKQTAPWTSPFFLSLPVIVYAPGYVLQKWHYGKLFGAIASWASTDSEPSEREQDLVVDFPRRIALDSFYFWMYSIVIAMLSGAVNFDGLGWQFVRIAVAIVLGSTIGCSLVYLSIEDALRPLYARVLSRGLRSRMTVGVRARLTLIWIVGAATFFASIVLVINGMPPGKADGFVIGVCAFALLIGLRVTFAGARSVAKPLDGVSAALARVEAGDLEASVPVDDAGEIGRLQAGFNRMVAGLRERERLERLFARHVGRDVARRAVAASGLSGTQTQATVMFVDIIGSTALAAERPPEAVVAMINGLYDRVIHVIEGEGGLVNQFQGDGALCVFGAPFEMVDHAARGLRAATALRREVVDLGNTYPGFDAAIGVSTGLVVAGDVGTEERSEYTVIGDAANEAKRLTDQAKERASRVLVSETTVRAAGSPDGDWIAAGTLELRGRPTPTGVFEPSR